MPVHIGELEISPAAAPPAPPSPPPAQAAPAPREPGRPQLAEHLRLLQAQRELALRVHAH